MKAIKVLLLLAFIIGIGAYAGTQGVHFFRQTDTQKVLPALDKADPTVAQPATTTKNTEPATSPTTLRIPKIQVNAHIESVGMDKKGRMDVPKNADNVAWYNLGYKVGEVGNAVMAGHLDKVDGSPAVFWDLTRLTKGDSIVVTDAQGKEYTYKVTRLVKYPWNAFPIKEVFGASEKPMLNLITCQGTFDKGAANYSHRFVVYSELVE